MTTAAKPKVAFIGTGIMGAPIAGHIMDAGYELTVYNRTKSKADALVARGATCDEGVCLGLGAVVDRELVAGVHDVAGDGRSHDAGADERDLGLGGCGHVIPFCACCRHGRLSRGGRPSLWVLAVTCLRGRGARCGP